MRAHQLSAKSAITIDRPTNIVLIPIRCTCVARPDDGQFTTDDLGVYVGGMPVRDAVVTSATNSGDHTPCFTCHRLARYTVYHRADHDLLERLRQPVGHRDVHDIAAMLEEKSEQVPVGACVCGAPGQETTSVEFSDIAVREDLNHIADDLSFANVRLTLDGETLWESDFEIWRKGLGGILDAPDPTPDEAILKSDQRMSELASIQARLNAAFLAADDDPPMAGYIRAKARLFCRIGADAYRQTDAFKKPDRRLSAENLAAIDAAMHQFADGRGFSVGNPLEVPVEFSHSVLSMVHFDVTTQMARPAADGRHFIDALVGNHFIDRREVVVFNRVPRGQWS